MCFLVWFINPSIHIKNEKDKWVHDIWEALLVARDVVVTPRMQSVEFSIPMTKHRKEDTQSDVKTKSVCNLWSLRCTPVKCVGDVLALKILGFWRHISQTHLMKTLLWYVRLNECFNPVNDWENISTALLKFGFMFSLYLYPLSWSLQVYFLKIYASLT
jgi:hypothetical protein